jgi:peptidoglycan/LPS O-acetylase OafA/YrhL
MKNKNVDGLRGLAAFSVAIAHFIAAFLPSILYYNFPTAFDKNQNPSFLFKILSSPICSVFYNGHFAVCIFFVLSGYVLALPYYNNYQSKDIILNKRVWGRYFRLNIPIFVAIFLSYLVYLYGLYFNTQVAELSGSKIIKDLFPSGMKFSDALNQGIYKSVLFGVDNFVPPAWTLRVEFVGSLYLLIFYILRPRKHILIPLCLVFLLITAIHKQDSIYFYGMFLASFFSKIEKNHRFRTLFFILGLYFGAFQFESKFYNFLPNFVDNTGICKKVFYNLIVALFITYSVIQGFGTKILQSRFVQFLGKISFSMYLIHDIIVFSLSSFIFISLPVNRITILANFVIYIFTCFVVSVIFEKYVDRTAIKISHRFSSKIFENK